MPRRSKKSIEQTNEAEVVEAKPVEPTIEESKPLLPNKDEYLRARATIKSYREAQKTKPKRKCTDKQLEALAKGREANKRFQKKKDENK